MPTLLVAGILGFTGVALGAFGAHGLEGSVDDKALGWWHTGVQYHLWHALLLVGIGLWQRTHDARPLRIAGVLVVTGVVLFSGSLYAMTLSGITKLGMVTPLGGLAFLGAWACVAIAGRRG